MVVMLMRRALSIGHQESIEFLNNFLIVTLNPELFVMANSKLACGDGGPDFSP